MSDLKDITLRAVWDARRQDLPVGSRDRAEAIGELTKLLLDEAVLLIEHHVPTEIEKRKTGLEVRRQQVSAAALAFLAFSEGWKHLRDAHGGRG